MSRKRQSFGQQAARFSLYAPFVALAIGSFAMGNKDQPSVAISLGIINLALITSGLCLGIAALLSIRRYGRQGILMRAIVGVVLNTMVVVALLLVLLPAVMAGRMKEQLSRRWAMQGTQDPLSGNVTLTFDRSGSFTAEASRQDGTTTTLTGAWVFTPKRVIGVTIKQATTGDLASAGKHLGLGTVKSVDDRQLILQTDHGEETYNRLR